MTRSLHRFSDFTLDIATRDLRRGGVAVSVPPRSFDAIAYLVSHRDRAVGRDELISAVWGKTSVSDTVLGKTILAARRALDDTVETPRYIRTVSRFGYHWIAAVDQTIDERVDASRDEPNERVATSLTSSPLRRRGALVALGLVALVFAAIVVATRFLLVRAPDHPGTASRHVSVAAVTDGWTAAVIPAAVSAREEDAWLRLGLMDLVALRLRGAGIATMPSDALIRLVQPGMGTNDAARAVREAGSVQQVFLPSVRRDGATWAVKIALLRPEGVTLDVEETAVDVIGATNAAVDRLLQRLGHSPVARTGGADQLSLDELLQRLESARLGDDLAGAHRLMAQASPAMAARPEVRLRAAQLDLRAGHPDDALHALDALLSSVSAEGAPTLRAQVLYARGTALLLGTHYDQARVAYDEGIALLAHQVEPDVAARLYMGRGNLSALEGRYEAATADHARARVAFQLAGDAFTTVWLDGNEGALQNYLGRPAAALPLLLRAEQHFQRYNVFNELVTTQANEVVAYLALVQPADALAASERSLPVLDHIADASLRRLVQLRRAMALAAVGRNGEARTLLDGILEGATAADEGSVRGMAKATLAAVDASSGQTAAAVDAAQAAVDQLTGPRDIRMRATAWMTRLRALRALGRVDEAATLTRVMVDWSAQAHHPFATQQATLAAAEQSAIGDDASTQGGFEQSLAQATALDLPAALVDATVAYARFLIAHGRREDAIAIAGRVSRFAEQDYACAALQVQLYRALGRKDAEALARERMNRLAGERVTIAD